LIHVKRRADVTGQLFSRSRSLFIQELLTHVLIGLQAYSMIKKSVFGWFLASFDVVFEPVAREAFKI
jgi:hypothetical protein